MPGSSTTPGRPSACVGALGHIAFRYTDSVGTRNQFSIAAQWLACTFPYRRFADILADACARLGADVVRYSFIVVDLHHLLLAGLPAHLCKNAAAQRSRRMGIPPSVVSGRRNFAGLFCSNRFRKIILVVFGFFEFLHSQGQNRKSSMRANVFRCSPNNGHQDHSLWPIARLVAPDPRSGSSVLKK